MACPKCGTIGLSQEQLAARTCRTCRHSRPVEPEDTAERWPGYLVCKHPMVCVCMPRADFFCSEWEGRACDAPQKLRPLPSVPSSTYTMGPFDWEAKK